MNTGNNEYKRGIYHLSKVLENGDKYYTIDNSNLIHDDLHTEIIKLEKRNHFNSETLEFYYYLRLRTNKNWLRCKKTGLAITSIKNVFEGNISNVLDLIQTRKNGKPFENPKHFILAQLLNDDKILVLDIFKDFYPVNRDARKCFINEHDFYKNQKKGAVL
jgi:hypothetical protein